MRHPELDRLASIVLQFPDGKSALAGVCLLHPADSGFRLSRRALFLQSGLDKVVDRRGNRSYLDQHFAKSPLAGTVGPMFAVITILEVSAGALLGVGCALLLLTRNSTVAYAGAVLAAINIIALFFGQRVAKDYAGAAVLVPYFLLAMTGIFLLAEH